MTWSRIGHTNLAIKAQEAYQSNPNLRYHVWAHVQRLYWHAVHTYGFGYDLFLDYAILTHDVVYDEKPQKELRSAQWLATRCHEPHIEIAQTHIMRTANPRIEDDNRMILLDLADLRAPATVIQNRALIRDESIALYAIDAPTFARANLEFFENLAPNFSDDELSHLPEWEKIAFREIRHGIELSIALSRQVLQQAV